MELNNIKSSNLNWGDAANDLNQNFGKINNAIEQVKNATTRNKGYFTTSEALIGAYPNGVNVGDYGYVGIAYPFDIWKWDGSNWYDTGVNGGEDVKLNEYIKEEDAVNQFSNKTDTDAKLTELGSEVDLLNNYFSKEYSLEANLGDGDFPLLGSFKVGDIVELTFKENNTSNLVACALIPRKSFTKNLEPPCSIRTVGESLIYTFEKNYDNVYLGIYDGTAKAVFRKFTDTDKSLEDLSKEVEEDKRDTNDLKEFIKPIDAFKTVVFNDGGALDTNNNIITHSDFGYTDYIEVPFWCNRLTFLNRVTLSGVEYSLKNYEYATYDANKNFIETIKGDVDMTYITKEINPLNVRYVRINYGKYERQNGLCVAHFSLYNAKKEACLWEGKSGHFLGDSITAQGQYTSALASLLNIKVNNYGRSGTTISDFNDAFYQRVSYMSDDCDFIFVLGGTNDWGKSVVLGVESDESASTFYGGLKLMFNALRAKFPTKPIFISTILQRDWQLSTSQVNGIDANNNGDSIADFNTAIKVMSQRYGAIVIDGYGESGIIISNIDTYTDDRLHLNAAGGLRYATLIKDKLEQVTPY